MKPVFFIEIWYKMFLKFLTREYAKRDERVIGEAGKFTP